MPELDESIVLDTDESRSSFVQIAVESFFVMTSRSLSESSLEGPLDVVWMPPCVVLLKVSEPVKHFLRGRVNLY